MCAGIPILADNKKATYGKKTNSHSTTCEQLKIDGDKFRKFEYLWWEKKLIETHTDDKAEEILAKIDKKKSRSLAEQLIKKDFKTQDQLAKWLKGVPLEWDKLLDPQFKTLAKKVNPKLILYQDRIAKFKKTPIEKYNPYQATKLPEAKEIKKYLKKPFAQVWDQVRDQVRDQVWDQVRAQVWDQVRAQVWDQVRAQVWDQVRDQEYSTSYWGVKVALNLPIKHWFFDWLKLGVIIVIVNKKVKIFGKKGKFLGEYDEREII